MHGLWCEPVPVKRLWPSFFSSCLLSLSLLVLRRDAGQYVRILSFFLVFFYLVPIWQDGPQRGQVSNEGPREPGLICTYGGSDISQLSRPLALLPQLQSEEGWENKGWALRACKCFSQPGTSLGLPQVWQNLIFAIHFHAHTLLPHSLTYMHTVKPPFQNHGILWSTKDHTDHFISISNLKHEPCKASPKSVRSACWNFFKNSLPSTITELI